MHGSRHRCAEDHEPVSCHAFELRTQLACHGAAWLVALSDNDFETCKAEIREGKGGQGFGRAKRNTLSMPGLPDPVAEIAEVVVDIEVVESCSAKETAILFGEHAEFETRPVSQALGASVKPEKCFLLRIGRVAPRHPQSDRVDRFANCDGEGFGISSLVGAKNNALVSDGRHKGIVVAPRRPG